MDGLKLPCEFTFNKKKKGKTLLNCSVEVLFYSSSFSNVLFFGFFWLYFLSLHLPDNGHCGFKKLNCPRACAERCDWWAWWSPWKLSWKQERLLSACGSSQSVWLSFRKLAYCPAKSSMKSV